AITECAYTVNFPVFGNLFFGDIIFLRGPEDIARPLGDRKGNIRRQGPVPVSLRIQESEIFCLCIADAHEHEVIRPRNRSERPESLDQLLCRGIAGMHILAYEMG